MIIHNISSSSDESPSNKKPSETFESHLDKLEVIASNQNPNLIKKLKKNLTYRIIKVSDDQ